MQNAGLDEAQAGIKIAGRNTNHLRCADDTTLMAESEEVKSSDTSSIETVYNSQDMEVTYMPISRRMDKEAVVHIHHGILLSLKKNSFESVLMMDETGAHYTE